jgi:hypothetical protein
LRPLFLGQKRRFTGLNRFAPPVSAKEKTPARWE